MKKKSTRLSPLISLPHSIKFTTQIVIRKKQRKFPDPPSEETVLRLNAIVKEAPFCFYYQERENDLL
ncbi:MAG: hypothetical protein ABI813_13260 [Bacteroidota bacterium]